MEIEEKISATFLQKKKTLQVKLFNWSKKIDWLIN